jgi:hypothetical protein
MAFVEFTAFVVDQARRSREQRAYELPYGPMWGSLSQIEELERDLYSGLVNMFTSGTLAGTQYEDNWYETVRFTGPFAGQTFAEYYGSQPGWEGPRRGDSSGPLATVPPSAWQPVVSTSAAFPTGASAQEPILAGSRSDPFGFIPPPKPPSETDRRLVSAARVSASLLSRARSRRAKSRHG